MGSDLLLVLFVQLIGASATIILVFLVLQARRNLNRTVVHVEFLKQAVERAEHEEKARQQLARELQQRLDEERRLEERRLEERRIDDVRRRADDSQRLDTHDSRLETVTLEALREQERVRQELEMQDRMRRLESEQAHELRRIDLARVQLQSRIEAERHQAAMSVIANIGADKAPVRFRAGAPRDAAPGGEISVRFAAYAPADEDAISPLLAGVAEGASARPQMSETSWVLGTVATVVCYGDHLHATPREQTFTWEGRRVLRDFDVSIGADVPLGTALRLKFDVYVDGIVVARLRIELIVASHSTRPDRIQVSADAARTAFASYASQDRPRVLDRVASVQTATGLSVWLDCVNLRPNDRWKDLLGVEIAKRDLFFLFWSSSAAQSHWVEWEWRSALATKGLDAMQIHPLENLAEGPPAELKALHATDALMDVREGAVRRLSQHTNR